MNRMNNQAMLGLGQPFRAELTERQEANGGGGIAKTFVKIILTLIVIGVAIIMIPVAFCFIGLIVAQFARSIIIGIIFGVAGVIGVFVLANYLLKKISKKK